jgi:thioredoxin 1
MSGPSFSVGVVPTQDKIISRENFVRSSDTRMSDTVMQIQGNKFQDEVVNSSQPVVVDFYADWCGPCKVIEPVIHRLSEEYQGRVKFVKIDTDANQELAMQFGIMSIPTVMFFSKGKVDDIVVGAVPAAILKSKVDALTKKS